MIDNHPVVSHDAWIEARKQFLIKEKEFTRLRDELSAQRRALPWELVSKQYVFEGPNGQETLADLFAGRSQLVVYHFMLGQDWEEGCKSCSIWRIATSPYSRSRRHLLTRLMRTGGAWAGASSGSHPPAATSIATIT